MPIPEPKYQNSAGRFLAVLNSIKPGNALLDTLPPVFDIRISNARDKQQACLAGLMELHRLYLQFRQDMLEAEINDAQRNVLLSGLSSIEESIYPIQMNAGFRAPTDAEKSLLEVCATVLPQEAKLETDDISAIRESIASLRTIVESGDISPTLRKALLELIRLTEDAISRFNTRGASGLKKAFKQMLGEAAELYGLAGQGKADDVQSTGAWNAIIKHLRTFDTVASRLLKYKPLIENATQLFLGGPAA